MEQIINIEGMTCEHCEKAVKGALEKLPGVKSAKVTLDPGQAVIDYDNAAVTIADMESAIAKEGYTPMIPKNM